MSELLIFLLVGAIVGKELLRAYHEPERALNGWMRWLNVAIGVLAVVFVVLLVRQVQFVLTIY